MKLAGDVSLGPNYSRDYQDVNLSQANPELLMYNTLSAGPATLFGAYPRHGGGQESNDNNRDNNRNSSPAIPGPFPPPESQSILVGHQALFFSAPLDNVTRLQVLGDPRSGHCHAVLLDYANGSRRALGNCRLGVDPVIGTYLQPARICCRLVTPVTPTATATAETAATRVPSTFTIARTSKGTEAIFVTGRAVMQVDSGPEPAGSAHRHRGCCGGGDDEDFYGVVREHHYHDNGYGWRCSSLQGNTMKMWFSSEKSIIRIAPATMLPTA